MGGTETWVWIVVGVIAGIGTVLSVGNYIHDRITPKADEYHRAKEALETYEVQQRTFEEQQLRAARQLDRQDALLDRIERLVEHMEMRIRSKNTTGSDPGSDTGIREI